MRTIITFTMKPEDYREAKEHARSVGLSFASYVKTLIARDLKRTTRKNNSLLPVAKMNTPENNT